MNETFFLHRVNNLLNTQMLMNKANRNQKQILTYFQKIVFFIDSYRFYK